MPVATLERLTRSGECDLFCGMTPAPSPPSPPGLRGALRSGALRSGILRGATLTLLAVQILACQREKAREEIAEGEAPVPAATSTARVHRPAPAPKTSFQCSDLRSTPEAGPALVPETIELGTISPGKRIVLSKTGVVVTFSRDDFITVATCKGYKQSLKWVEEEAGFAEESPLRDAYELPYVAAALLDVGRAKIRFLDEGEWQKQIVRDGWAANGCAGQCRSFGRLYRVSADAPDFFMRVTDKTATIGTNEKKL
jgi:hypothetical protein